MMPSSEPNQPSRILSEIPVPQLSDDPNVLFAEGLRYGTAHNYIPAAECYLKAAERGHIKAQVALGHLYFEGKGVEKDDKKAFDWLHKAAEQGDSIAQYTIGLMYHDGDGVEQDYSKALHWYQKSAGQGYYKAQYNLGHMYEKGNGVPVDYQEMLRLYLLAARQGDGLAQNRLSFVYGLGWGVPVNFVEAYKWCLVAGTNQCPLTEDAELAITGRMTASQMEQARQNARNFIDNEQIKAPEL
jgi:TPR repeat protein